MIRGGKVELRPAFADLGFDGRIKSAAVCHARGGPRVKAMGK